MACVWAQTPSSWAAGAALRSHRCACNPPPPPPPTHPHPHPPNPGWEGVVCAYVRVFLGTTVPWCSVFECVRGGCVSGAPALCRWW